MTIRPIIDFFSRRLLSGKVTIFTGAGMSTASGLPDFRSAKDGIWGKIDPMAVASTTCLNNSYEQFREFYKMRLNNLKGIVPNQGHHFISNLEKQGKMVGLITQNVDGLHEASGSTNVAAIHGRLRKIFCECCRSEATVEMFMNGDDCEKCHGHLRPGVVLFGEVLPKDQFELAEKWTKQCQTFVVLGSSLQVSPANYFPQKAKKNNAKLIIINNDKTDLDKMADLVINEPIVQVLEETERAMKIIESSLL